MFTALATGDEARHLVKKMNLSYQYDNGAPVWTFGFIDLKEDDESVHSTVGVGAMVPPEEEGGEDMMRICLSDAFLSRVRTSCILLDMLTDEKFPPGALVKDMARHVKTLLKLL